MNSYWRVAFSKAIVATPFIRPEIVLFWAANINIQIEARLVIWYWVLLLGAILNDIKNYIKLRCNWHLIQAIIIVLTVIIFFWYFVIKALIMIF